MKKYTFLILASRYEAFLGQLRDAGVVHVTLKAEGLADNPALQESLNEADSLRKLIAQGAPDQLLQEKAAVQGRIDAARKEVARMEPWGEFDSGRVAQLREAGYGIRFFTCSRKQYAGQGIVVNEIGDTVYGVLVGDEPLDETLNVVTLNEHSVNELQADLEALNGLLVAADARIEAWQKAHLEETRRQLAETERRIDWQKVELSGDTAAEGSLRLLEGFCPACQSDELNRVLDQTDCYYEAEVPAEGDATPIKLENGFFARLFEPITRLYSLPSYTELDLTPFLAPFFMLFFGLCLGDGGYGLLLLAAGVFLLVKKPDMKDLGWLGVFMGGMTMIVGILTGMFFGINLEEVAFLKPVKDYFITETNCTVHVADGAYHPMMVFAIAIGVFQILTAMALKIVRITMQKGFKYAVYDLSWLVFLITCIVWLFFRTSISAACTYAVYVLLVLCGLGIMFYSNPDRRFLLLNIGGGLWGTYNMVSGLLGDILSYIRLFALGLAGGILGNVFNTLALQVGDSMPAWIGWLPTLLIMLLGHGLNFGLCLISSVVHPLRLTFVEFYKNAGFEGGGIEYVPFKQR